MKICGALPKTKEQLECDINRIEGYIEALEFAYENCTVRSTKMELLEQVKEKEKQKEKINYRLQRMREVDEAKS